MSASSTHCINEVLMINSSIIKGHQAQFPAKATPPLPNRNIYPEKNPYISGNEAFLLTCSIIKKILIFSQKKSFLIFLEMKHSTSQPKPEKNKKYPSPPRKKFLKFQEKFQALILKKIVILSQKEAFLYFRK